MALQAITLDDVRWAEMVEAIRRRIPAASRGKWTLHAPVDPGVTLLELFAWLIEQRIYWMDQVSPSVLRAILGLLGQAPAAARPAATVVGFPSSAASPQRTLPAGAELRLERRTPAIVFTTDAAIRLLPVEDVTIAVGGQDRSEDLAQGAPIKLLDAGAERGEIEIVLWLAEELDPCDEGWIGLLLELDAPASVAPAWSPEAVSAPPAADVGFLYSADPTGADVRPFAAEEVDDGTGGLRRSGVLRLKVPEGWVPRAAAKSEKALGGLYGYALRVRVERATYTAPPRLRRLEPNAVTARHRRPSSHEARVRWLPLPGATLALPEADRRALEEGFELTLTERGAGVQRWTPTPDLSTHGPGDRVFVVDREAGRLRFGDGLAGRLPLPDPEASPNVRARYLVGGGEEGNLGAGLSWVEAGCARPTARNLVATEGGRDPEDLEAARLRAGAALRRVERAVTRADFRELAETTPGAAIRRACPAIGVHPDHPCDVVPGAVTVFVVPDAPREDGVIEVVAPLPDRGALAAVAARLDAARLLTSEVFVRGARYRDVQLEVALSADTRDEQALRRRVAQALQRYLDPLIGGDEGRGWPFGDPLRPSALQREVQELLGDDGRVERVAIGIDGAEPGESCADVPVGKHDLVALRRVRVSIRRAQAAREGLR